MKTTLEMAREALIVPFFLKTTDDEAMVRLKDFAEFVRADERDSWPSEMEAMERQVNILTDALADEREACAKLCESEWSNVAERMYGEECAAAIRARSGEQK